MFIKYRNKGSLYNTKRNKLLLVKIAIILTIITLQICIWFALPKTGSSPFSAVCLPKKKFLCAIHIFKSQQLLNKTFWTCSIQLTRLIVAAAAGSVEADRLPPDGGTYPLPVPVPGPYQNRHISSRRLTQVDYLGLSSMTRV